MMKEWERNVAIIYAMFSVLHHHLLWFFLGGGGGYFTEFQKFFSKSPKLNFLTEVMAAGLYVSLQR